MLAAELVTRLKAKGWSIGTVESITCGRLVAEIGNVAGASSVLVGGLVTYQNRIKHQIAKVPLNEVELGVVREETALTMARNGQKILAVDVCLSTTGNAGPTTLENHPVGFGYIAIAYGPNTEVRQVQFTGTRSEIIQEFVDAALALALEKI